MENWQNKLVQTNTAVKAAPGSERSSCHMPLHHVGDVEQPADHGPVPRQRPLSAQPCAGGAPATVGAGRPVACEHDRGYRSKDEEHSRHRDVQVHAGRRADRGTVALAVPFNRNNAVVRRELRKPCRAISFGYSLTQSEAQDDREDPIVGSVSYSDLPAGTIVAEEFARWSPQLLKEFDSNAHNGWIGQSLLSETDSLRVWETHLQPGERIPVHRHVLDYFWIALTSGQARQHTSDGTTREIAYTRGESHHFRFSCGQYHLYDVKNIGDDVLSFLIIEMKNGENEPLQLPTAVK
ncbi:hypothetical protein ACQEU8_21015 [Streptomyces sp. CA-250714]|uniref:hypothetical protein n=1 Tax=Streptomyces sp. CA-250714 TaxID=3240060 RepID=UPI003D91116E